MIRAHFAGDPLPRSAPSPDFGQHASHRRLITTDVAMTAATDLDAIIIPTARPAATLSTALRLAERLACHIVVLCSREASAEAAHVVALGHRVELVALDIRPQRPPAELETSSHLASTPFARDSDTSLKRNLALAICRMVGWEKVLFLDDDVTKIEADEVRAAAALLDRFDAVGLENTGYFDNSVVCHANRATGAKQDYFVGAGALLINAGRNRSFFPDVYNEDWFFLLKKGKLASVAISGTCEQATFDPYAKPDRARHEEFGDCLAEGLFSLLDNRRSIRRADHRFWRGFLRQRSELIKSIEGRLSAAPQEDIPRIAAALEASRETLDLISADDCVRYLAAWRRDRRRWRRYLADLPRRRTVEQALVHLGLSEV